MPSSDATFRVAGEEDLERHEAKSLATFRETQGFHQKTRATRFSRSKAIIVFLAVTNFVLIAQCLGFWDAANLASIFAGSASVSDHTIPLEAISTSARSDSNGTSTVSKRRVTTALTEPSVSCDLCPEGDDFCMELG